jgi:hypothetical protein
MLSDEEIEAVAQEYVRRAYPANCSILHRENWLEPTGIYFMANYQEPLDQILGDAGFFVSRVSGEVWRFGSEDLGRHRGLENLLKWYAEGWRPGTYRLTVREVNDPFQFARLLVDRHVWYLVRELEHGVVWPRLAEYDEELVLHRLKKLPCTFIVMAEEMSAMLPRLKAGAIACFDYQFGGWTGKFDWRPEKNSPEQLGPQYE